jgi:hypothetical protein
LKTLLVAILLGLSTWAGAVKVNTSSAFPQIGLSTVTWAPGYCVTVDTEGASVDGLGVNVATNTTSGAADVDFATVSLPPNLMSKKGHGVTIMCAGHAATSNQTSNWYVKICGNMANFPSGTSNANTDQIAQAFFSYWKTGQQHINGGDPQKGSMSSLNSLNCDMTATVNATCGGRSTAQGGLNFDFMKVCFQ